MQRFRDLIFEDGRSEYYSEYVCAFRLLFHGFNFRGLPVNREYSENWIPRKFPAIRYYVATALQSVIYRGMTW